MNAKTLKCASNNSNDTDLQKTAYPKTSSCDIKYNLLLFNTENS